jgi:hypothetical protein
VQHSPDVGWPSDRPVAIVLVSGDDAREPNYIRRPFRKEPDFGVTSVNYDVRELLVRGGPPS